MLSPCSVSRNTYSSSSIALQLLGLSSPDENAMLPILYLYLQILFMPGKALQDLIDRNQSKFLAILNKEKENYAPFIIPNDNIRLVEICKSLFKSNS